MLNYEFPPLGGGAANATFYLLKEFSKIPGLQIDLITSSTASYKEECFSENIHIFYLDIGKGRNLQKQTIHELIKYSLKAYFFAKKLIKKNRYDLAHAFFGIPSGYIAMKLGLPYLVSLRGSDVPFCNKKFYLLYKLFLKRASIDVWRKAKKVVANSSNLRNLALVSAPNQDIDLIYNGVDHLKFHPRDHWDSEVEGRKFKVISTSRFADIKGVKYLMSAFLMLARKYKDVHLTMVGDGPQKKDLIKMVQQSGLEKCVDFLGVLDHERLVLCYQKADVFVLASINEGMSNSLLEAMASGLAIVTTDVGGVSELIDQNALIVNKADAQGLFIALERLYKDNKILSEMKLRSRELATGKSWKLVAEDYINAYKEIS